MSFMPSNLGKSFWGSVAVLLATAGCGDDGNKSIEPRERSLASSEEPTAIAVPLGNIVTESTRTPSQDHLSRLLFGEEPRQDATFFKPIDLLIDGSDVIVCDGGHANLQRWTSEHNLIEELDLHDDPTRPTAIARAADGGFYLADAGSHSVIKYDRGGREASRLALPNPDEPFRPTGIAEIDDRVWVSNAALHRIEVFDVGSASHVRSIGRRGVDGAEFGIPLGISVAGDNSILVVDMLNSRVQQLDREGGWIRYVGRPGHEAGRFGRPKDVAVGPDGTIFITDAASRCVHALDSQGRPLLDFGDQGDEETDLMLPAGIAITPHRPLTSRAPKDESAVSYYVLVAEQLHRPGIRVFAWIDPTANTQRDVDLRSPRPARRSRTAATNPHWQSDRCGDCHAIEAGKPSPIAAGDVDLICLSCHDGKKASAEPHPIGRLVSSRTTVLPTGFPAHEERLGCLTCHDIRQHCEPDATRPHQNPWMLRGDERGSSLDFCTQCHTVGEWRINPHRASDSKGRQIDACGFCHSPIPRVTNGVRSFKPMLRDDSDQLCLNCHESHSDPRPGGHVGVTVPEMMRSRMVGLESNRSSGTANGNARSSFLPLNDARIACYTCHNPHPREIFREGSPLGLLASNQRDVEDHLRQNYDSLCLTCHAK
jgi:hypothetical protein